MDTIDLFNKILSMGLFRNRYQCFKKFMDYGIREGDIHLVKYLNENSYMEEIKKLIRNERGRLERINVDKIYYRHLMESPEICITFKDKDYNEDLEIDYDYFIDQFTKLDLYPSVVPMDVWIKNGSSGWEEIPLD